MNKLGFFKTGSVVEDIESTEKFCAIHELLSKAPIASTCKGISLIEQAVVDREKVYTTGLGRGIAIAHGKTAAVNEVMILLGVSKRGIEFESIDGLPVHLLFLIANSPDQRNEYLFALSTLARMLRNKTFCHDLWQQDPNCVEHMVSKQFKKTVQQRN